MTDSVKATESRSPLRQLVFCREFEDPLPCEPPTGLTFFLTDRISRYLPRAFNLVAICGPIEAIKGCVRIVRGRQFLYGVLDRGQIVHYGWVTHGTCRHYEIDKTAYVIGPIWSAPEQRGRGAATFATRSAINEILRRGGRTVYIDTAENNFPCLRVIEKCQFGPWIKSYDRRD